MDLGGQEQFYLEGQISYAIPREDRGMFVCPECAHEWQAAAAAPAEAARVWKDAHGNVLMDGEIGVESEAGVGSVFWIELALTEPVRTPQPSGAVLPLERRDALQHGASHTLLYVEDNPANLLLVEKILARYRVEDAKELLADSGLDPAAVANAFEKRGLAKHAKSAKFRNQTPSAAQPKN